MGAFSKILIVSSSVFLVGWLGYMHNEDIKLAAQTLLPAPRPCTEPIKYRIANIDAGFNISTADAAAAAEEAVGVWNAAAGKKLFVRDDRSNPDSSDVGVYFIYDRRQQVTDTLQNIHGTIADGRAAYDALKAQYTGLLATYNQTKADFTAQVNDLESRKSSYTREQYAARAAELATQQKTLEASANQIDALSAKINSLAAGLNKDVSTYNKIGSTSGAEFDEGLYVQDAGGRRIDVYQYDTRHRLVRLLAHEFGHALGLGHVAGVDSIMYPMNTSANMSPSSEDLTELAAVCRI